MPSKDDWETVCRDSLTEHTEQQLQTVNHETRVLVERLADGEGFRADDIRAARDAIADLHRLIEERYTRLAEDADDIEPYDGGLYHVPAHALQDHLAELDLPRTDDRR